MKEVKFRAWNKKFMQYQVLLHGPYAYLTATDYQKGKMFRGPLMQFTGLRDKNGREIYEGDVVKHAMAGTVEIRWLNVGWTPFMSWHAGEDYEVIGNVFEGPGLIA